MALSPSAISIILFSLVSLISHSVAVSYDYRSLRIGTERKIISSGSIHYTRSTPAMWPSLFKKAHEGGLNTIDTFVFWNAHEPKYREYDFSGNLDLVRFIKTIQDEGLYAILRVGPYINADWSYGGLPVWLESLPGIQLRTNNSVYLNEVKTFVTLIVDMMTNNNLFESQGGPIILAQIEQDYGVVESDYGAGGKEYIKWCADLALSFNLGIPWMMSNQDDAPPSILSTCNNWYCDQWLPKIGMPKMWTENWTSGSRHWGERKLHRPVEDMAFAIVRFFQLGGTMHNYYMYHGGTNFGEGAGPYITTSYDYDAPLDEYGNINEPKWGHLRNMHKAIHDVEYALLNGVKKEEEGDNGVWVTSYVAEDSESVCFFSNTGNDGQMLYYNKVDFFIPGWSVSIVDDCQIELFNSAKVSVQTSIMKYVPNHPVDSRNLYRLQWYQAREEVVQINDLGGVDGSPFLVSNSILDQKLVTNGTSDYMWMMTELSYDPKWTNKEISLFVQTNGPVLHAFINSKYVGSQTAELSNFQFQFERKIQLIDGSNRISLLSVGVGFVYDSRARASGITGPVKIIARSTNGEYQEIHDISTNRWVYKTGLKGLDSGYPKVNNRIPKWSTFNHHHHIIDQPLTWYKTYFISPGGSDPVVVDLIGMGKGAAWINGKHLGRYWSEYRTDPNGCNIVCDYKGKYNLAKCNTECDQVTQRYYHIPRDWLVKWGKNKLVLFEELGGNPQHVQIKTVTIGKICLNTYEDDYLELHCQGGHRINKINFVSYGNAEGTCGQYHNSGICHAVNPPFALVNDTCYDKKSCTLEGFDDKTMILYPPSCPVDRFTYTLTVEAVCQ